MTPELIGRMIGMKIFLQKNHSLIKVVYVLTTEAYFLYIVCSKICECNMNLSVITRQLPGNLYGKNVWAVVTQVLTERLEFLL